MYRVDMKASLEDILYIISHMHSVRHMLLPLSLLLSIVLTNAVAMHVEESWKLNNVLPVYINVAYS